MIACTILTRPSGQALFVILLLTPVLGLGPAPHRSLRNWLLGISSALVVLLAAASWNYAHYRFLGLDRMGGIALFCSTAEYLNPNTIEDKQLREALKPFYENNEAHMHDGRWIYSSAHGPFQTLSHLYPPEPLDKILKHLAFKAIVNNPVRFLRDRCALTLKLLRDYTEIPLWYIIPETSYYVYQGLALYHDIIGSDNQEWKLLRYGPKEAQAYFAHLKFIPTGRPSGHLPYVPRSEVDTIYHYDHVLSWWSPLSFLINHMRWLSIVAIVSSCILLVRAETRYATTLLLLVILLQAAISSMAAWQDSRFAVPILPLYYMLALSGIQSAGSSFLDYFQLKDKRSADFYEKAPSGTDKV